MQKVKLESVLSAITKQTELTFVYSQPVIDPNQIVSIEAKNEEVASVLKRIFDRNKVEVEIINKKIYLKPKMLLLRLPSKAKWLRVQLPIPKAKPLLEPMCL